MIHFVFSDKDSRYLFLKADFTDDENVPILNKKGEISKYQHVFRTIKDTINLIDPVCYLPTWSGPPVTRDFIWDYTQPGGNRILYCSIGLWQVIYKVLKKYNIPYDGLDPSRFKRELKHSFEEFKEIVDSWGLSRTPRPYQYESAYKILQWKQSLSQLATRAGKTLIAYIIFRYCIEYLNAKKILMIVPSIDLVKQGYNDFNEYAEFFKTECVWSGGKLVESSNITIGTFQSLIKFLDKKNKKYNPHFFDDFDIVFCDETHRATAEQTKTIISQPFMRDVKIAFGMTGTLPKENTIPFYCLHALLGATIQTITPRELMDAGYISDIEINQVHLHYQDKSKQLKLFFKCAEYALGNFIEEPNPKNPKKKKRVVLDDPKFLVHYKKVLPEGILDAKVNIKKQTQREISDIENSPILTEQQKKEDIHKVVEDKTQEYIKLLKKLIQSSTGTNHLVVEKMMVHFMDERVNYLCTEILSKCEYNTLVLAHHTEYINYLVEEVKQRMPDKIICCITGATGSKQRDAIKQTLSENNNCVLIASYGCVGTGITLSNLCFGVLFESFMSDSLNMQSLGRGLGLSKYKDKYVVYDIIDCFDKSVSSRSIFRQGKEKVKIYEENKYDYNIIDVKL